MKIEDLYESPTMGMYDAEQDQRRNSKLGDTRRGRVTLKQLNKLRKYRDFRKVQDEERDSIVAVVYAQPADAGGGAEGMM